MLLQTPPISSYQLKKHIPSRVVMNNNVPTIIYEYTHSQDFGIIAAKHLARESAGQNFCLVHRTSGGWGFTHMLHILLVTYSYL